MLSYQKNGLLSLLANFKARLYDYRTEFGLLEINADTKTLNSLAIIDRNITSIEKKLKKL